MIDNHCYGYILMEENGYEEIETPLGVFEEPKVDEDPFIYADARRAAAILIRNFRRHRKYLKEHYPDQDDVEKKLVFDLNIARDAPWKTSFAIYNNYESVVGGYIKRKEFIL